MCPSFVIDKCFVRNLVFSPQNGAEDLRIKLDTDYSQPSSVNATTPSPAIGFIDSKDNVLAGGLASSIAPADMLNVWNATKMNSKGGTVNTADGILFTTNIYV